MRNRASTVAFVLAMAFVLCIGSACSQSSSAAPTKPEYLAAADAVCQGAHNQLLPQLEANKKQPFRIDSEDTLVTTVLIPGLRAMIQQLAGYPPPAGDGPYLGSIYSDYMQALDIWSQYPDGTEATAARADVDERLAVYGLVGCVKVAEIRPGDKQVPMPTTTTLPPGF